MFEVAAILTMRNVETQAQAGGYGLDALDYLFTAASILPLIGG
jgi:hypothetical protein